MHLCREEHSESSTGREENERIGWFRRVVKSWPLEYREALLRYMTGFKRAPFTDRFKAIAASPGSDKFSHFSINAMRERTNQVHVLLVPHFNTCEELEENLLHTICNCNLVCDRIHLLSY